MARLILAAAALVLACPSKAQSVDTWSAQISEASWRFGIPEPWIRRVMRAESGGHVRRGGRLIVSRAGAMGLMQLMPGTWATLRVRLGLGTDPHEPRDNILAGTFYLRMMYDRFGYPGLFAAYNAGPGRYARHLATGRPLPRETVAYVTAVAGPRNMGARPASMPVDPRISDRDVRRAGAGLFAVAERAPERPRPRSSLFVPITRRPDRP